MKQDNRLQFIHIRQINQTNVNEIYQKQFNRFLFDYSDEVNIDGKIYSNTGYDKMMRFNLGYLKNEKGEPNFKKIYANGIKDGFKLTENDFVEYELEQIIEYTPKGLTEKKQLKTYKEYLEKRLSKLNKSSETTHHFDSNQPLKNYSDFIEHYQIFFKNLKNNYASQIEDYYNVLDNAEIGDIGYRAVNEIKNLLLLQNNNAETLKNVIKNDLGKLKKLHDEAIKEHKFFNAKNENNKYLPTFIKAVDDLNIFVDTITLLIENKSTTIKEPQQETKTDAPPKKDFKQEVWFKVAVLFASGKMKKFYTLNAKKEFVMKPEYTAPKIAKDKTINKPNYDKNILATLNNYETKKNIFNRTSTELKEVIKHCVNKKIDLDHDFIERYNLIKDK